MSFQVFLSYARNDDQPLPGDEGKGFITTLIKALEESFKLFGPPTPAIFRDIRAIGKSDQFDPMLQEEISKSQAMLVVLSNNWIYRDWCLKELDLFGQQWKNLDERAVRSKIFVVGKNFIEPDARPRLLQGQSTHEFYAEDDEKGGYRELFKRGKQDATFYDRAEELARDLWKRARQDSATGQSTKVSDAGVLSNGRKIYLAKPAKDMDEAYLRLVDELQRTDGGYIVVPGPRDAVPSDRAAASEFIDKALKQAELSVHLLGEKDRLLSVDDPTPVVKLQLDRAAARAASDEKFNRVIWAPKIVDSGERDALDVLKTFDAAKDARDKIMGEELGKFRDDLVGLLRKTAPHEERAKPLKANARVYVYHKLQDTPYALSIAKALQERQIEPLRPAFQGDQAELNAWHREQLKKCDAVVVCWGPNASEVWARATPSEWVNWKELGREKDFSCRALIAGPPAAMEKEAIVELPPRNEIDLVLDLTAYEKPTPEMLDPLINPLSKSPDKVTSAVT